MLDYGEVVVHCMFPFERTHYNLEGKYARALPVRSNPTRCHPDSCWLLCGLVKHHGWPAVPDCWILIVPSVDGATPDWEHTCMQQCCCAPEPTLLQLRRPSHQCTLPVAAIVGVANVAQMRCRTKQNKAEQSSLM